MQALLKSPPFLLQLRSLHCHPPRDGACQWQPFTGFLAFRCGVERGVDVGSWLGVVVPRAANGFVRNPDIRVEAGGLLPFGHARQDAAVFKACGRDELHEGREDARAAADGVFWQDVFRDAGTVNHEGDGVVFVHGRVVARIRADGVVAGDDEEGVGVLCLGFLDEIRDNLVHVPDVADFERELVGVIDIGHFVRDALGLFEVVAERCDVDGIGRMVRDGHDDVDGRVFAREVVVERREEVLVVRAPGRLLRRVVVGIAIKMVEALREREAVHAVPARDAAVPEINAVAEALELRREGSRIDVPEAPRLVVDADAHFGKARDDAIERNGREIAIRRERGALVAVWRGGEGLQAVHRMEAFVFRELRPARPAFAEDDEDMARLFHMRAFRRALEVGREVVGREAFVPRRALCEFADALFFDTFDAAALHALVHFMHAVHGLAVVKNAFVEKIVARDARALPVHAAAIGERAAEADE